MASPPPAVLGVSSLVLGAALLAMGCGDGDPGATADRPDVLLVSIDSLRYDHLGCYGYARDTSPTIDRLAGEGARFEQALSTTSWTLPSHAALFTGLYDSTHGLTRNGLRLADEHRTLAEALRDAGYQTAGFYGGPYLHPSFGLAQGFEAYQSCMTRLDDDLSAAEIQAHAIGGVGTAHADVTGPRLVEEVTRWLQRAGEEPWFLFLHMWDVHYDYVPPPGYVERFDPDYDGNLTGKDFARNPAIRPDMPERDREHLLALYDGEIRFTDDILARILEELEQRGRLADTLVVVTADHGEEFFEHRGTGHRRTLFDEVIRVPLILRWPGRIAPGLVIEDQVSLIDVMPTVLALVGVPLPAEVQGRDLSPLLEGSSLEPVEALVELRRQGRQLQALRTPTRKVISAGPQQLLSYDLEADPGEQRPLPPAPELAARLQESISAARAFRDGLGERGSVPSGLAAEIRERLEALGYLAPGGGAAGEPPGEG